MSNYHDGQGGGNQQGTGQQAGDGNAQAPWAAGNCLSLIFSSSTTRNVEATNLREQGYSSPNAKYSDSYLDHGVSLA